MYLIKSEYGGYILYWGKSWRGCENGEWRCWHKKEGINAYFDCNYLCNYYYACDFHLCHECDKSQEIVAYVVGFHLCEQAGLVGV